MSKRIYVVWSLKNYLLFVGPLKTLLYKFLLIAGVVTSCELSSNFNCFSNSDIPPENINQVGVEKIVWMPT